MSVRREDTASKPDDLQTGSSWIPVTPAKPGSTDRQPICTNRGENETVEANWVETEKIAPIKGIEQAADFVQNREPACYTSTSLNNASEGTSTSSHVYEENLIGFESWLAGEAAANPHLFRKDTSTYNNSSINDPGKWKNISFGNLLLAMSKKEAMEKAVAHNDFATSSTSSCCLHPQFEGSSSEDRARADFVNARMVSTHYFHPQAESSQLTMCSGNSLRQDQHTYTALSESTHYQFQPITPEMINRGEYQIEYAMKNSSVDQASTGEKNEITTDGVMQEHGKKKRSHLVDDQLCEVSSTQLQENHKPDKGGMEETDLVKTPQQKTRRKKHRPKVVNEGQKKNNPTTRTQKTNALQETTRVKRKYVRKNVVTGPVGVGTNGTDSHNKTPSSESPVEKRKYRRKRGISMSEDTNKEETTETAGIQAPQHTRRSCRRSLNFNTDETIRDGISSDCSPSNCEKELQAENFNANDQPETAHSNQETEVMVEKKDTVTGRVYTRKLNKLRENFLSKAEQHPESCLPPINMETLNGTDMVTDQTKCTRGKCQIVFSDVTHDREANSVKGSMNPDGQGMQKSSCNSIDSGTCLTPEKQKSGLKRQNMDKTVEATPCSRNEMGIIYNSLEAYLSIFTQNADTGTPVLHFPEICKKKRTEKVYSAGVSSMHITAHSNSGAKLEGHSLRDSCKRLFTSPTNQGSYGAQSQATNLLSTKNATYVTRNGRQVFEDLLALEPTQKRRRSKAPTRQRNLASLLENCKQWPQSLGRVATTSRTQNNTEFVSEPLTCIEALVADTRSGMKTKKRSKRSILTNPTVQNVNNHQHFAGTSLGPPLALTWKSMSPVDSIIDKLSRLDLNADSSASEEKYNALMRYRNYFGEDYALVPFQNSGTIVPFDQVRRRKPRPKVDLDDETTRVWRLLLENINSEGIDGTNEENTKWWEEERRVFVGRADSFIARMHLIQGDRHFSPWKGSVVDSVVGVFLTQNVSDHLSSSAFMSLAARYPAKHTIHLADLQDERSRGEINEPGICELDSDETFSLTKEILNDMVCIDDSKTLQEFEDESISKVNSMKPLQNASGSESILEGNLRGPSINTYLGPVSSCEFIANRSVNSDEDGSDTEDTLSSETPEISSQNSAHSPNAQTTEKSDSCLLSTSEEETMAGAKPDWLTSSKSFVKLLQMTGTVLHGIHRAGNENSNLDERQNAGTERLSPSLQKEDHLGNSTVPAKIIASCNESPLCSEPHLGAQSTELELFQKNSKFSDSSRERELCTAEISELSSESASGTTFQKSTAFSFGLQKFPSPRVRSSNNEQIEINKIKVDNQICQTPAQNKMQGVSEKPTFQQSLIDATGSSNNIGNSKVSEHKDESSNMNDLDYHPDTKVDGPKSKKGRTGKEKDNPVDWDQLRKQAHHGGRKRERTNRTLDSVDWDAIRCADVNEIAETIKERGMNNMLAERIKDFLNRIVKDHGSIDLEWLRDVPPDKAKEYLLSIRGLGLKSVECIRLLTLHHVAFPVDTNVGRIAVRLGWVPLQPLPESLQLHLLELYPVLESIQKYLWPRLCKLDQKTLYELHYQMITFGKVFCTKSKPNCNACPMRGECRHFASAFASARLALPAPQDKSIVCAEANTKVGQNPVQSMGILQLPSRQTDEMGPKSGVSNYLPVVEEPQTPEPIIEVPATPEPDYTAAECDIENAFSEDPDEIPTIHLNLAEFTNNLQTIMQQNTELQEGEMSKALVALTSEAASIPVPKLKNVSRLRTEHQVYELPDSHPILEGMDKREPDDPSPYLLAIWTPGETMDSIEPPEKRCSSQGLEKLCTDETCSSCNSIREAKSQTVRGTLLIPCRTAMRGSFPLNGTYFQVNEVFSDHESSLSPMDIPRVWLWNLPRRTVYFGTSIPSIFKGLSTEGIQYCFWRGFVCVRGFDRKTRAPRPLIARLHFPASKLAKGKGKIDENIRSS